MVKPLSRTVAKTSRRQNRFRNFRGLGGFGEDQGGAFEQAAEIFFARRLVLGVAGELLVRRGLVADFEPFKLDDADIFRAAFPNLALSKFHGYKKTVSPGLAPQERQA